MTEKRTNSQELCDVTLDWWNNRRQPRDPHEPGTRVAYAPLPGREKHLLDLAGTVGYIYADQTVQRGTPQRIVQFGGEEDGAEAVRILALVEELIPL